MPISRICLIVFLCLIGIVSISTIGKVCSDEDPYPSIEIPVMLDGYHITRVFGRPPKTKSLNYFILAQYPANEVLQFYDSRFKKIGYIASFNKFKKQWECFIDGTIEGNPRVRQLLALWINPELEMEAFLALRYVKAGNDWGNELHILCQIQPLIETTRLEEFLRQLDESKQHAEFMKLLDSYRMSNGEVDINKAISENRDNVYLMEYKRIIDEMSPKRKPNETQ